MHCVFWTVCNTVRLRVGSKRGSVVSNRLLQMMVWIQCVAGSVLQCTRWSCKQRASLWVNWLVLFCIKPCSQIVSRNTFIGRELCCPQQLVRNFVTTSQTTIQCRSLYRLFRSRYSVSFIGCLVLVSQLVWIFSAVWFSSGTFIKSTLQNVTIVQPR